MIAVLKSGTSEKQLESLIGWIESLGLQVHLSRGEYQTIVGLVGDTSRVDEDLLISLSNKLVCFVKKTSELEDSVLNAGDNSVDPLERARYFRENIFAKMQELRAVGDSMETETAADFWPYPSYTELLFGV